MANIERGRFLYNSAPRVIISPGLSRLGSSPHTNLSTHMSPSSRTFFSPKPIITSPIPATLSMMQRPSLSPRGEGVNLRRSAGCVSPTFKKEINEKLDMMDSHRTAKFREREVPELTGAREKEFIGSSAQLNEDNINVIQPRYFSPQPEVNEILILENMLRQTLAELNQTKAQNSMLNQQIAGLKDENHKKSETSRRENSVETLNKEKLSKFIDINHSLNKLIHDKSQVIQTQKEKIEMLKTELQQKNELLSKQGEAQVSCLCNTTHQSAEQTLGETSVNRSIIETEEYRRLERLVLERLEENEKKLKIIVQEQKVIDMNETIKDEEIHRKKKEIRNLREKIKTLEGKGDKRSEFSPQPRLLLPNDQFSQVHLTNSIPWGQPNYLIDPRGPMELHLIEKQMASMKITEVEKALDKANKKYRSFKKLTRELKTRIDLLLQEVDRQNKIITTLKEPDSKEQKEKI